MTNDEIAVLRARAEAGEREAMTAYGKRLLCGDDGGATDVAEGAHHIAEAAAKGSGEALAQQAVLVAAGIANVSNWESALDLLQRAAERDWAPAQEQLRLLAHGDGSDFAGLRRSVDIGAWIRPPAATVVFESPRVITAQALMSKAECDRVIAKVRGKLSRAGIYDVATGGEAHADHRSNSKAEISLVDYDVPYVLLLARMSMLLGLPSHFFEPTNVLHYKPGEEFKPHFDYLSPDLPGLAANVKSWGQRVVTLLVYLNEDYESGETEFPRLSYAFKGRTGDALMFGNANAQGGPEELLLHAGLPPVNGEKWLLSQWVRNRSTRAPRV